MLPRQRAKKGTSVIKLNDNTKNTGLKASKETPFLADRSGQFFLKRRCKNQMDEYAYSSIRKKWCCSEKPTKNRQVTVFVFPEPCLGPMTALNFQFLSTSFLFLSTIFLFWSTIFLLWSKNFLFWSKIFLFWSTICKKKICFCQKTFQFFVQKFSFLSKNFQCLTHYKFIES